MKNDESPAPYYTIEVMGGGRGVYAYHKTVHYT
jgi:hypothetical protein